MGTRKVIVELMLEVPDGVELPTSEEISDDLTSVLGEADGAWRLCGCETWLNDVSDLDDKGEGIVRAKMCGEGDVNNIGYEAGYAYACGYHD